jgi:nucleoside-diphosphate-sugar epimerase
VRVGERLPGASVLGNHLGAFESWLPLNCTRAERELGLRPRPVTATLTDALRWYEEQGVLKRRTAVV